MFRESVRERMRSHLLDFNTLANASYKGLEGQELVAKLKPEFEAFLRDRAKLFHSAVSLLAQGKSVSAATLKLA